MAKLWDKGGELDALIERFTVGNDYLLDRRLIAADSVASIAHVRMLESIGVLSAAESTQLQDELRNIAIEGASGGFDVSRADEDGHTAIENRLVERLGESGKRVHTGRSRNDQVLASTRLFMREAILETRTALHSTVSRLLSQARTFELVPMPGRTHLQPAMPSSVGLWFASYADLLLDDETLLHTVYGLVNRSPLGAAAGYGVPLPLDREMVAELLGFAGPQHNVIAVNNSRGKVEAALLESFEQIGITLGRLAQDLILFSMPEFGYFRLPAELCTGSSIMPQKQNPDGLELLRGKGARLGGLATIVKEVVRGLPSGYNRDVQETKEPVMEAIDTVIEMLRVAELSVAGVEVDQARLESAFTPELLATDEVFKRVADGESFRDAYRFVAAHLDDVPSEFDAEDLLRRRTSTGTPGNPGFDKQASRLRARIEERESEAKRVQRLVESLVGRALPLFKFLDS